MMNYVGLDISKLTIDAAIKQDGVYITSRFNNDKKGFIKLNQWIKKKNVHVCMEATGIYYEEIACYLSDKHLVSVVNPLKIKKYSEAVFSRTKNDKQDAQLIADYCANMNPPPWLKPTDEQRRLDKLIALQNQLINKRTAVQNRLHSSTDSFIIDIHRSIIDTINNKIDDVKDEIESLFTENEDMKAKILKIKTIDGIGKISAPLIVNYLQTRKFDNSKQYIAFLGLCPSEKQSGTSVRVKGRLTKYGHRQAKSVYFMPALVAYRNRMYPDFIKRLEAKGKPKKVIITALMRKLATIAYYVYTTNTEFDRSRYRTATASGARRN